MDSSGHLQQAASNTPQGRNTIAAVSGVAPQYQGIPNTPPLVANGVHRVSVSGQQQQSANNANAAAVTTVSGHHHSVPFSASPTPISQALPTTTAVQRPLPVAGMTANASRSLATPGTGSASIAVGNNAATIGAQNNSSPGAGTVVAAPAGAESSASPETIVPLRPPSAAASGNVQLLAAKQEMQLSTPAGSTGTTPSAASQTGTAPARGVAAGAPPTASTLVGNGRDLVGTLTNVRDGDPKGDGASRKRRRAEMEKELTNKEVKRRAREMQLKDFLLAVKEYGSTVPGEATRFHLQKGGLATANNQIVTLMSLAADHLVANIVHDSSRYRNLRLQRPGERAQEQSELADEDGQMLTNEDLSLSLGRRGIHVADSGVLVRRAGPAAVAAAAAASGGADEENVS